jgi:15-cis-phytoene synthase
VEPALRASYDVCRRMHRRHDPTYYWATRRLPPDLRPPTHALYGYVRTADELVDGPSRHPDPAARRAALDAWEAELEAPRHPVAVALADAGRRHDLPLDELHQYMDSMRMDCDRVRIGSWEDLDVYTDGSAGTVGRIMAVLLAVPERRRADFGRLGQAFQLTNFLRDVREDRALDRMYLPAADPDDRFEVRAAVAEGVLRARRLFRDCETAVAEAPAAVRPGVRVAAAVYWRVLDRIEAVDFDVLQRRRVAPPWTVAGAAVRALRA